MTQTFISYLIVGVLAIFVLISFVVGLEKMAKIILGNYILLIVSLSLSSSIDLLINMVSSEGFSKFLIDGKITIILIIYALLLFLIYHKSKITINIPHDQIMQKSLYLVFVPLTVLSMFLVLETILIGNGVFFHDSLLTVSQNFSENIYLQKVVLNTPYLFLLHGLLTIFVFSEFKLKVKTDIEI